MITRVDELPQRTNYNQPNEFKLFENQLIDWGLDPDDAAMAACILATEYLEISEAYSQQEQLIIDKVWKIWENWNNATI